MRPDLLLKTFVRRLPWTVLVGALIGMVAALLFYDGRILSGDPETWRSIGGDSGSGLAGFRYFVSEGWSWKLFDIQSLGAGTHVTTTDSNAALALVAKLLRPAGFTAEEWWGAWFALSLVLQGCSAVIAVRAFGIRNWMLELFAAVLAVCSPILLLRAIHPALMGQFVLLLALAVVGSLGRSARPIKSAWIGTGLCVVSVLIHPYFLPMTAVLIAAAVAQQVVRARITVRDAAIWAGGTVGVLAILLLVAGILQRGLVPDSQGFSLNTAVLAWPVVPQRSGLWPSENLFVHPFSFEGFAFLGFGLLIAALVAAFVIRRDLRRLVRDHQLVVLTLVMFGLYSISPRVVVTDSIVWDFRRAAVWPLALAAAGVLLVCLVLARRTLQGRLRLAASAAAVAVSLGMIALAVVRPRAPSDPHRSLAWAVVLVVIAAALGVLVLVRRVPAWNPTIWVVGTLCVVLASVLVVAPGVLDSVISSMRASGRFVWISWYAVLVGVVVALARVQQRRIVAAIAAFCCVVQVVDISPLHDWGNRVVLQTPERSAYVAQIREAISGFERVQLVPPMSCTLVSQAALDAFRDVVIAASQVDVPVNVLYSARALAEPCADRYAIVDDADVLTVAVPPITTGQLDGIDDGVVCVAVGEIHLCHPG